MDGPEQTSLCVAVFLFSHLSPFVCVCVYVCVCAS